MAAGGTVGLSLPKPMEPFSKSAKCKNCKIVTKGILHVHYRHNGAKGYMWVCSRCNQRNPFTASNPFISNEQVEKHLSPEQIAVLPEICDPFYRRCAVCGARDCDLHHWAVKEVFGKDVAERWPQ